MPWPVMLATPTFPLFSKQEKKSNFYPTTRPLPISRPQKNPLPHSYNISPRPPFFQIHIFFNNSKYSTQITTDPPIKTPLRSISEAHHSTMVKKEMDVMKDVDLKRYMGRWYEIASFPSRFQPKNGANTRATYTLRDERTVNVLNETWVDGKRGFIEGTAVKANPDSDEAKLKVKFYVPPFMPIIPVVGDYWVLYLDHDYHHALIGQPSRNYLWVCMTLVFLWGVLDVCELLNREKRVYDNGRFLKCYFMVCFFDRYCAGRIIWMRRYTINWWRKLRNRVMM